MRRVREAAVELAVTRYTHVTLKDEPHLTGSDCCARAVSVNTLKQTVSMSVCVCRCPTCLHGAGLPVVTVTGVALLLTLHV